MTRSLNVLSKILGLTASSNPHEAKAAEAKLEQQLLARGITKEQLEQQLDMSTVDEDIEVMAFRYGAPYKRIDPAVSIILGAVTDFYNGKLVFTPFKMNRTGNKKHQKEYIRDSKGNIHRQMEITANKARKIEIEIYTDYLLQALNDDWAKHCKEDPFKVAMEGAAYRNSFRKAWARKVDERFSKMKKDEETNGRQLQLESKTVNQSALAVTKANQTELAKVEEFYAERYPTISSKGHGYTGGGSGSSAGRSAGSSVGLSRQVSGGGQKQLSGY
jgi:hypothetical protein|tara:strand:+ start:175 stop:996 length:822 start_codon:yes stop_codon:yes gene_type:complete